MSQAQRWPRASRWAVGGVAEGVGTGAAAAGNLATAPLPSRLPWHWPSPPPGPPPFSSAFLGVSVPHWVSYARETPHRARPTPLSREAQESNLNLSLKDEPQRLRARAEAGPAGGRAPSGAPPPLWGVPGRAHASTGAVRSAFGKEAQLGRGEGGDAGWGRGAVREGSCSLGAAGAKGQEGRGGHLGGVSLVGGRSLS